MTGRPVRVPRSFGFQTIFLDFEVLRRPFFFVLIFVVSFVEKIL